MTSITPPLASCIMPTAKRRRFVPGAIAQFLTQIWADAELVILDDGSNSVADLIPAHPAIRYLRTARRTNPRRQAQRGLRGSACRHHPSLGQR